MTFARNLFFAVMCVFPITIGVAEDLSIPVLVGQTGASATFGRNETDAYTLAAEDWNNKGGVKGKRIVLRFEDTQTSAKQIVTGFQRFAATKAPVVLGPTWLDGFPAIIPMARQKDILLVTPSAAIEAFSESDRSWPVTFYHNSTTEIKVLLDGLRKRNLSRLALVYEQEPFAEMIRKLVLANDIRLVADIGVQAGESDFRPHLLKLRNDKIDAIIVFVWDERSLLALLQQIRIVLPDIQLATVHDGAGWLENSAFKPVLPRLIFTRFIVSDNSFAERFKARFAYPPILTASNAYDALNSVLTALAAGCDTGSECRDYIMHHVLETVTFGKFQFGADGSVPSKVEVMEFPAGKL